MSAGAAIIPTRARLLILEDCEAFARDLATKLNATGRVECHTARCLEEFVGAIDSGEPDGASIDWRLGGYDHGAEALEYMAEHGPDTGRLVYTFFDFEQEAGEHDADYFLRKQVEGGVNRYLTMAMRTLRLGLGRKTAACLRAKGHAEWSRCLSSTTFDPTTEDSLYTTARDILLKELLGGEVDTSLRDTVMRAGRWRRLNKSAYIKMTWRKKLSELCGFAGVDPDGLARILNADCGVAEALLYDSPEVTMETPVREAADHLLSIFSHVLQLAQYEPEAVSHYWKVTDLYVDANTEARPPWDSRGLSAYLQETGQAGLQQAVYWIWRH